MKGGHRSGGGFHLRKALQQRRKKLKGPDGTKAVNGFLRTVTARDKRMESLLHNFANLRFRRVFKWAGEGVRLFTVFDRNVREWHGFFDEPKKSMKSRTVGTRDNGLFQEWMLSV